MTITERDSDLVETREAVFSTDHRYRYLLTRIWNPDVAPILFICLNPSTADAMANDPTVRRMCGFGRRENAGGIVVANLFALRSSNPAVLKRALDPVGPDNDEHLRAAARAAARVVVAWGAGGSLAGREPGRAGPHRRADTHRSRRGGGLPRPHQGRTPAASSLPARRHAARVLEGRAVTFPSAAAAARSREAAPIHVDGYHCDRLEFDLDLGEHRRRQAVGLGAVPDLGLLDALMDLPAGYRLDYRSMAEKDRSTVRWLAKRLPPGALEVERSGRNYTAATRLISPILRADIAIVEGRRYAQGHFKKASWFAPMCRRAVTYPAGALARAEADPLLLTEYDLYGVGLGERADAEIRWIVEPGEYRAMRFTPAAWWFAERVYGQWLQCT